MTPVTTAVIALSETFLTLSAQNTQYAVFFNSPEPSLKFPSKQVERILFFILDKFSC